MLSITTLPPASKARRAIKNTLYRAETGLPIPPDRTAVEIALVEARGQLRHAVSEARHWQHVVIRLVKARRNGNGHAA